MMASDAEDPYRESLLRMAGEIGALEGDDRRAALIDFRRSDWWEVLLQSPTLIELSWVASEAGTIWNGLSDDERYPAAVVSTTQDAPCLLPVVDFAKWDGAEPPTRRFAWGGPLTIGSDEIVWLPSSGNIDLQATLATFMGGTMLGTRRAGTGGALRTVEERFADRISVKDYGAKGDGTTDDTTAIRNAIAQADGKRLFFPSGTYKVSEPIVIGSPVAAIAIEGETGIRTTTLLFTGSGTLLTATSYLDAFEIRDIHFRNAGDGAIALQLYGVRAKVIGCSSVPLVSWSHAVVSTFNDANYLYDVVIRDCYFDNTFPAVPANDTIGIELAGGHTVIVDHCMVSGFNRGIKVRPNGINSLNGLSIVNSRIEAFSDTLPYAGGPDAIGIEAEGVTGLYIAGTNFEMAGDQVSSAADQRAIFLRDCLGGAITGCHIACNGVAQGGIVIGDATKGISISGNYFFRVDGYGVIPAGGGDLTNVEIGNNHRDGATTAVYDNTFTPTLSFGGASVGVDYFRRRGFWQRIGNLIQFTVKVQLNAKGSSVGTAIISGLPSTAISAGTFQGYAALSIRATGMTGLSATQFFAEIVDGESSIRFRRADTNAQLADSAFTNITDLVISGQYQIAS